ncbi:Chromate resistance protein ChrB [Clostridium sp. DJ247]|uniref:Chromate resistance protein ChrB n=1 Tax=Clostridium sp. DJ247 TaxID=2726188 RepID=UPI00162754C3|nr:Chromate resistance protein ChrB [Clostridium sp. DJ247]MBC2581522.1 hypothetical protein [Clostridium sp. DJ247]
MVLFCKTINFIQDKSEKYIIDFFNTARDEEYKEFLEKCKDFNKEVEKETKRLDLCTKKGKY